MKYHVQPPPSFMRVPGLGLKNRVWNAKMAWLYREALEEAELVEALFNPFDGYPVRTDFIVSSRQIPDTSILAAPSNHKTRDKTTFIKNCDFARINQKNLPSDRDENQNALDRGAEQASLSLKKTMSTWTARKSWSAVTMSEKPPYTTVSRSYSDAEQSRRGGWGRSACRFDAIEDSMPEQTLRSPSNPGAIWVSVGPTKTRAEIGSHAPCVCASCTSSARRRMPWNAHC